MRKTILALFILTCFAALGHTARAQTDPAADGSLVSILAEDTITAGDTDVSLPLIAKATQATATTTAETLTMMKTPSIVSGAAAGMDATAASQATTALGEIVPGLQGSSSISTSATTLQDQEKSNVLLDETEGSTAGNPADQQMQHQLQISTNLQGMALDDFETTINRFDQAGATLEAKLDASPDLKTSTSLNGEIAYINFRENLLIHKTIAEGVIVQEQAQINEFARDQRIEKDRKDFALALAVTP